MNDFRDEVNKATKEVNWTLGKVLLKVVIPIMVFAFVINLLSGVFNVAKQPMAVVQKTMNADNIIHKYEWFHDVSTQYDARVNQIVQFKSFLADETDVSEKQRLRMEMAAQQQSCRDLAAKYNANSEKMNVSIFKGWSLPDTLAMGVCDAK